MLMSPLKLIALRAYMITLGRFPVFSKLIRKILVTILIKKTAKTPYVASSRFFDVDELAASSKVARQ
jgi:hypothetical protein